jgi:hypothetical protein
MRVTPIVSLCAVLVSTATTGCNTDDVTSQSIPGDERNDAPTIDANADAPAIDANADAGDGSADNAMTDGDSDGGDFDTCSAPGDCVIAANDCCGGFPVPYLYSAIRRDRADAWRQRVCPSTMVYSCDASFVINDKLLAYCIEGKCKEINVPEDPVSACSSNDDCAAASSMCETTVGMACFHGFAVRADQVAVVVQQNCPGADAAALQCPVADAGSDAGSPRLVCGTNGHCELH